MKLTNNSIILSGAFAALLTSAAMPVPGEDREDGFWAKAFTSVASVAYASEDDDSDDDSSDDSDDDSSDDDSDDESDDDSSDDEADDVDDDVVDDDINDDVGDDVNDDGPSSQEGGDSGSSRVQLQVSGSNLSGLVNGSLLAVDNLGRVLEIEVEVEHGVTKVIAKPQEKDARNNPGPITSVTLVPAT